MKKILSIATALLFAVVSVAGEIKFVNNLSWKQIKEKAAREKKMIFFDAYATWCGPCKYLEQSVYTDESVAAYYNTNFINVKFDMEKGEGVQLSTEFNISGYPTLLFFSPEGKLLHKYVGAMEVDEFLTLGKDAKDPSKQYYSLRSKVAAKAATDLEFETWAKTAKDLEEEDRTELASSFLANKKDLLASAALANAVISYVDMTDARIAYLYKNKARLQQLMQWDASKTNEALYTALFNLAIESLDDDKPEKEKFMAVIKKYDPAKTTYASHEIDLVLALSEKDYEKAMNVMSGIFNGPAQLPIEEASTIFLGYISQIEGQNVRPFVGKLASYKFSTADQGKEGWLYLVQAICYNKTENEGKAKEFAKKAYEHPAIPQEYKDALKESYGL